MNELKKANTHTIHKIQSLFKNRIYSPFSRRRQLLRSATLVGQIGNKNTPRTSIVLSRYCVPQDTRCGSSGEHAPHHFPCLWQHLFPQTPAIRLMMWALNPRTPYLALTLVMDRIKNGLQSPSL